MRKTLVIAVALGIALLCQPAFVSDNSLENYNAPCIEVASATLIAPPTVASAWAYTPPTIDAFLSDNEWGDASKVVFTLSTPELHDCCLYVKNDAQNLYLLMVIEDEEYNLNDYFTIKFDNDNDGIFEFRDDSLIIGGVRLGVGAGYDNFFVTIEDYGFCGWIHDTMDEGTNDIVGAARHTNPTEDEMGTYTFEFSHPLNTEDDPHDFSLFPGDIVGFRIVYRDAALPDPYLRVNWPSESLGNLILAEEPADNLLPVAIITGPDQPVSSGDLARFFGSNSYDPDGTIVSYQWDFGDGTMAEGEIVSHRFRGKMDLPKSYTVSLTVKDDDGNTGVDNVVIIVKPLKKVAEVTVPQIFLIGPPAFARVTARYNWVNNVNGDDIYMVSYMNARTEGIIGYYNILLWDEEHFHPIWSDLVGTLGYTINYYPPPFKNIFGGTAPYKVVYYEDEIYKGTEVTDLAAIQIIAYGMAGSDFSPDGPGLPPLFFEVDSAVFQPDYVGEPDLPTESYDLTFIHLCSPGELRVYDSQGLVTGLINGKIKEEIPNSTYNDELVMILSSSDLFMYEVKGTDEGSYGLGVATIRDREFYTFTATTISTSANAIHQYMIAWDALSQGEEGVTVQVDSDGDGTFECTFSADKELTQEEFLSATDTIIPTIESVTLDTYTTIPDATIHVTVEATDNVGVTSVTADDVALVETGSTWDGDITAPSDTGDYTLTIIAEDAAENVAETAVDYSVVTPTGGLGVAILPKISSAPAGSTLLLDIKIVSTENFEDILHLYVTLDGIPPDYQADLSWFSWTDTTVQIPAGQEIVLSIEVDIPDGITGYKSFGVKAESTKWSSDARDYGAVLVT